MTSRPARRAGAMDLLLLAGACGAALVLLEAALRLLPLGDPSMVSAFQTPSWEAWMDPAWSNPGPDAYRHEPVVGYEHAAGVDLSVRLAAHDGGAFRFRTNDVGLRRDVDTALAKPPGVRRVLVLGDSHTDGYVDNVESFSTLLESTLAEAGTGPLEVLNAGVVGYSPAQATLWYERRGVALAPDVVVLVLYTGNDVLELADPSKPGIDPVTGAPAAPVTPLAPRGAAGPSRFAPRDHLDDVRIVAWTRAAIRVGPLAPLWRRFDLPGNVRELGELRTDAVIAILRQCHGCFWQSLLQAAYAVRHPDAIRRDVATAAAIATGLAARVRTRGGTLVVAVLPTRAQVEPERARPELEPAAALLELGDADLAVADVVEAELAKRLTEAGVPVVVLGPALRRAADGGAQYYERDWHLAPRGHRTVAEALAPVLTRIFSGGRDHVSR